MNVIHDDWYRYPQYYDQAYRGDTKQEADFLEAAFARYAKRAVRRLLEPACGSGRLVAEMAARGYEVAGFDLCEPALAYLGRRLRRRSLAADVFHADMADFEVAGKVDAAYNTFSTFRHLTAEKDARRHLQLVADCLGPGGVYVLGLHFCSTAAQRYAAERYTSTFRGTKVTVKVEVVQTDRRRRIEWLRTTVHVVSPTRGRLRLTSEAKFRLYTIRQFHRLLAAVPQLRVVGVHDFRYRIDEPRRLDDRLFDAVVVLGKSPRATFGPNR